MTSLLKRKRSDCDYIDASAYPHIIDSIFSFATPSVLISLRTASRSFQYLADTLLFQHVVLDLVPATNPTSHRSHGHSVPLAELVPPFAHLVLLTPCGHRLPGGDWGDRCVAPAERARWARLLAHTWIVDYRTAPELAVVETYPQLASALANVDIVRRKVYTSRVVYAPTVVEYADFTRDNPSFPTPRVHFASLPHGLARWVLNVRVDPANPPVEGRITMQGPKNSAGVPYGTDVVAIFSQTPTSPAEVRPLAPGAPAWGVLAPILDLMVHQAPVATRGYTIVGVTQLPRALLGMRADMTDAELEDEVIEYILARDDIDLFEDERLAIRDLVRFLTREEYAKLYGPDWDVISEWPEDDLKANTLVHAFVPEVLQAEDQSLR
ncbi:uncharacterized protein EHS24_000928 [Apiotrichum porosum]|uniref:Uncharacterized protein n=1 Tax=Apiotrichum porosum TaxID=105984 RepID=A0A427YBB1_9TREE|nr:uncharacterized protein EHS24_000928 [Apiotrichum porosum]RSH88388.1 hypothetical protein EHS24_000928 [Apiotrichum porosum]